MYTVTADARSRAGKGPVRMLWARLAPSLFLPAAAALLRYQTNSTITIEDSVIGTILHELIRTPGNFAKSSTRALPETKSVIPLEEIAPDVPSPDAPAVPTPDYTDQDVRNARLQIASMEEVLIHWTGADSRRILQRRGYMQEERLDEMLQGMRLPRPPTTVVPHHLQRSRVRWGGIPTARIGTQYLQRRLVQK